MYNQIQNKIGKFDAAVIGISVLLMVLPWAYHLIVACTEDRLLKEYPCAFAHSPLQGLLMNCGVFLAIGHAQYKGWTSVPYGVALQIVGVAGVLGFRGIPVVAITYMLLFVMLICYKKKGSKYLAASPGYTCVILFVLLMLGRYEYVGPIPTAAFFESVFSHGGYIVLLALLATSSIAVIFSNFWTKNHSVIAYILAPFTLVYGVFYAIVYTAASNFSI